MSENESDPDLVKFDRNRAQHRRPVDAAPPNLPETEPYGDKENIPEAPLILRKKSRLSIPATPPPEGDSAGEGESSESDHDDKQRARRASRQTATFLSKRLTAAGLRPVSKYGQNFLIDLNLVDLIARSADIQSNDVVLEIGTGVGSLTSIMAEQAGAILTVEIDKNLFQLAAEELDVFPHVKMIHGDALRNKNSLREDIMQNIRDAQSRLPEGGRFMLVANLPYNVATPIISNLLHESPTPDRIVVTIQKELGERIVAKPGSKDYGALSVWVQSMCRAEIVRILPPTVFWPRPKVESAVIRLDLEPERRAAIPDLKYFHNTVRALFFHRRKFLRSVVISAMKGRLEKTQVDTILQQLGHGETARAEELDLQQIMDLAEALRQAEAAQSSSTDT
ncbi:dimethyladenosine transferase [Neorhodopirellula lusitana]|uniref:Ribosomal RNA small subunit methyltransferase A n=1 Tax=Neorhodopirellula lusitana TaxID=445327 RepID=A0ABY1QPG8_9BACT|nr:16S rRNA (adenine(1518)-N(6)/adenine(1519)-N(6))-dimethyltransferase RsmA [Neorhodopirellula lusitana]SMP76567.1 dimethyladenosine transferase [Neorhodopirellula lusitana]